MSDSVRHEPSHRPVFIVPQPDGSAVTVDLSRPGAMGDLWIDVEGPTGRGFLLAYHTNEAAIITLLFQQWASQRGETEAILNEIDAVRRWLEEATADRTPTTESQHQYRRSGWWSDALASGFAAPSAFEGADEVGWPIEIVPEADGVRFIRPDGDDVAGAVELFVPNDHLHLIVAGLIWRTFGEGGATFSLATRHNTAEYVAALDEFEQVIRSRR